MLDDPSITSVIVLFVILFALLFWAKAVSLPKYWRVHNVYTPTQPKRGGEGG